MQMYIHPREDASPCNYYIRQLDQFMQIHIPHVHIGFLRGKYFKQSNQYMQKYNSPQEGENTCGGGFNQSESTILNLFLILPRLTRSPREGVRVESNQPEEAKLCSLRNTKNHYLRL